MDRSHFRALSHLRNFIPCAQGRQQGEGKPVDHGA